jgi:double-strand break repair protein MRE11
VTQESQPPPKRAPARKAAAKKATPAATARQTQLSFTGSQAPAASASRSSRATGARAAAPRRLQEPIDDEISDDDDAFETPPASMSTRRR